MEITKIFSELGGEEKLYSISLDETEMALFSEFQKEFASVRSMKKAVVSAHKPLFDAVKSGKLDEFKDSAINDASKKILGRGGKMARAYKSKINVEGVKKTGSSMYKKMKKVSPDLPGTKDDVIYSLAQRADLNGKLKR